MNKARIVVTCTTGKKLTKLTSYPSECMKPHLKCIVSKDVINIVAQVHYSNEENMVVLNFFSPVYVDNKLLITFQLKPSRKIYRILHMHVHLIIFVLIILMLII